MKVVKKEGEAAGSLLYRFTKKVQHSGVVKEVKKRRFLDRPLTKTKRRLSAIHKDKKADEVQRLKKLGKL
ncbi:MAG: 30S ribosomal protein S21 [Candidatus Liptonbacteria bacterium CG11_big_fil_rev_8_21_14_0_20_35_14]|uniref:Small ribosomal subunit protein bS21 n=1 Tax=Candidatus Liptonbacteria bacterium CG11_big_fil_rev_8_21_14_0_20_35_14 TaxID=1974634 RepID=A0A2H0N8M7_9BACT|nr:MAG: 30S ribosomal protein S21 [Candidatus Liptonbacteria bacterium CG11_big_fil_rev_8_21_14_0_20_35_14]